MTRRRPFAEMAGKQLIRLGIPGSLLIIWGVVCYEAYRLCQGAPILDSTLTVRESVGALVAILATIPIGFLVYQIYYAIHGPLIRPWPFAWRGRLVRVDRGYHVLHRLQSQQVSALGTIFDVNLDVSKAHQRVPDPGSLLRHPWRKFQHWIRLAELREEWKAQVLDADPDADLGRTYSERWHDNWDVLRTIVDVAAEIPGSGELKKEYSDLADVYHGLGATRLAIRLGWLAVVCLGLSHLGRIEDHPVGSLAGFVAISLPTFAFSVVLHLARQQTWHSASASLRFGLRWLFWREAGEFVPKGEKRSYGEIIIAGLRSKPGEAIAWVADVTKVGTTPPGDGIPAMPGPGGEQRYPALAPLRRSRLTYLRRAIRRRLS